MGDGSPFLGCAVGGAREVSMVTRGERIAARVSPEVTRQIQEAASLAGCSVSAYVASVIANAAAGEAVGDPALVRLSLADSLQLANALLAPRSPNEALRAAFKDYRQLTGKG